MPTTMLTQHFSLEEMTASQTAAREGIPNVPDQAAYNQLVKTCQLLEIVRAKLGFPILISSGYRGPQLNAAIGGAPSSQHMTGQAADFTCPGFGSPHEICHAIMGDTAIRFDQLIWEYASWVHISQAANPRMQTLTIDNAGTRSGIA